MLNRALLCYISPCFKLEKTKISLKKVSESDHITTLLHRWQSGDAAARDELFETVYRELRRIAASRLRNEMRPHTLQATELVHEIYPQLARQRAAWQNRSQFFAIASECMRRYLVDYARTRTRQKRGGIDVFKISLSDLKPDEICRIEINEEVLAVDRALEKLKEVDETAAIVIKHRYFGGMKREEIAEILQVSPATIDRTYRFAKAWLKRELAFEFSPYLLHAGQIKNGADFIRQLQLNDGNSLTEKWRGVLSAALLDEIKAANDNGKTVNLLPEIIAEINKSLLGSLNDAENNTAGFGDDQTAMLPEAQIKFQRRMLEEAFAGQITRLT